MQHSMTQHNIQCGAADGVVLCGVEVGMLASSGCFTYPSLTLPQHTHATGPRSPQPPPLHLVLQAVYVLAEAAQQQSLVMQQLDEVVGGRGLVVA
jgi:hypothetical protein